MDERLHNSTVSMMMKSKKYIPKYFYPGTNQNIPVKVEGFPSLVSGEFYDMDRFI